MNRYFRNWRGLLCCFVVSLGIMFFCAEPAYAAYKQEIKPNKEYKIDLDGGKKETIRWSYSRVYFDTNNIFRYKIQGMKLYVNDKPVSVSVPATGGCTVRVLDCDTKDKYKEIIISSSNYLSTSYGRGDITWRIYRWEDGGLVNIRTYKPNGTNSITVQSAVNGVTNFTPFANIIDFSGMNNFKCAMTIASKQILLSDDDPNDYLYVPVQVSVKYENGVYKLDLKKTQKLDEKMEIYVKQKVEAWQYARMGNNFLNFTLNPGEACELQNIKIDSEHVYLYLKHKKTKKKGWIIITNGSIGFEGGWGEGPLW